jgi:hypothetical protein
MSETNSIVEMELIRWQSRLLEPIVQAAVADREHCLFIAAAFPDFQNGEQVWKFQLCRLDQKTSRKLKKLLQDSQIKAKDIA